MRSAHAVVAALVCAVCVAGCGGSNPNAYIASAQGYLAQRDYNAAMIELKNALKIAPNNGEARLLLARVLLENGQPVDAETEARKALDLKYPVEDALPLLLRAQMAQGDFRKVIAETTEPRVDGARARANVSTLRGLAFLGLSDIAGARTAIGAALASEPGFLPAKIAEVRLTAAGNDLPGALARTDAILAAAPDNTEALILKAELQSGLGRNADGIATLRAAAGVSPDNPAIRWALVFALVNDGKVAEAAQEAAVARKLAPDNPRTWYSDALVAYAQGNLKSARDSVERAKHFAPNYVPAMYLSGLIDTKLGALGPAEAMLRAVVTQLPNDASARRALATVYTRRGKTGQALDTLEPLLRAAPDDPALLRAAAEIHLSANNAPKAAELFARANALDGGSVAGRVRLAQVNLAAGDPVQALRELERLAASEPTSTEPDLALVSAYLKRREFAKAISAAEGLEKKQPQSPVSHNIKGVVLMSSGEHNTARASFEKALVLDPDYAAAAFNLARLDLVERNYDGARKRYEAMLVKDPQNETILLALAELLAAARAPAAEIRAGIDRAIAANPTSPQSRLVLVAFHASRKDWPAALNAIQKAQAAIPDNVQIVEALGMVQFAAGEPNQAIATFRRAAQMQPQNPSPLARQAEIQLKIKDYDGAIEALRSALDLAPDTTLLWITLAGAYADAGRYAAGVDDARRLQRQRPDRAVGFALEGELHARQKKWPDAVAAYRVAFARQPAPFVVVRLHAMLGDAGRNDEAAKVAAQWIRDHPQDVVVRAYLAEVASQKKDYRTAAQHLRNAVEIEPDNVPLVNNLAFVLGELGDPKALEYAAHAYALSPNFAATNDTYGWLLVQRGDKARGIELLRRATELAPNDADKRLRYARALIAAGDKDGARKELATLARGGAATGPRAEAEKMLKDL